MEKKGIRKVGRPALSEHDRRRVLEEFKASSCKKSFRALGRELGIAAATVARVLRDEGLVQESTRATANSSVSEPRDEAQHSEHRPNLRTVATKAGVSVSTASLALRGDSKVARETRERVRRIASEMNYEVHPYIGAQLAAVRRRRVRKIQANLAYLYSGFSSQRAHPWSELMKFPSGPKRYFEAAKATARKRGYTLEPIAYFEDGRSMARLAQILKGRGIRGLILDAPAYVVSDHPFDFSEFATVALRDQNALATHVFGHDNFLNTLRSICHLWRMGYRRIGYIVSDALSVSTLFAREAAVRHAQYHLMPKELRLPILHSDHNLEALHQYIHTGERMAPRNRVDAYEWAFSIPWQDYISQPKGGLPGKSDIMLGLVKRWIDEVKPELVICENSYVLEWLKTIGLSVPKDVGLVHNSVNFDVEGWTGMKRANESIGAAAAEHLCNSIELGQLGLPAVPIRQRFSGEWLVGETTQVIKKPLTAYTEQADRFIRRALNEEITI